MRLPKSLKIAGRVFNIEYLDFEKVIQHTEICGSVIYYKQKIQIDTAAHREFQEMSLLHEAIHVISNNYSLKFEEDTVRTLGMALYQVLNDNDLLK